MVLATGQPGSHKLLVWMRVTEQVGYWVTIVRVKLVYMGGVGVYMGVYMAFFPECKDSSEPSLASRKRRPNKNNMRTNHQGSSPNKNVVNCGNSPQFS